MKKILLLCVTSQNVITFRAGLIKTLQEKGYEVSVVAFDDEYQEEIQKLNVAFYCVKEENRGMNPLKILTLKGKYYIIYLYVFRRTRKNGFIGA